MDATTSIITGTLISYFKRNRWATVLVADMHTDACIAAHKGLPVITDQERYRIIRGVGWVDDVAEGVDYFITPEILDSAGCDVSVHGDDVIATPDGQDSNSVLRDVGRYKECKRTDGISTTDLVGRMLLLTKEHHSKTAKLTLEQLEI